MAAAEFLLNTYSIMGRRKNAVPSVFFAVRLPPRVAKIIRESAKEAGMRTGEFLTEILGRMLGEWPAPNPARSRLLPKDAAWMEEHVASLERGAQLLSGRRRELEKDDEEIPEALRMEIGRLGNAAWFLSEWAQDFRLKLADLKAKAAE